MLVATLWGLAFVATRIALDSFSAPALTALRFLIPAVPAVLLVPRPLPWSALAPTGLTLFAGQFLFQFFGIALGTPPGLASILVHTQAFFTVLFAAVALGEAPTRRQTLGMAVALAGLVLIALTIGRGVTWGDARLAALDGGGSARTTVIGFGLTLLAAVSWAIGNVLLKRLPDVDMLRLVLWLSVVPPVPALALSVALDGPADVPHAIAGASWTALAAVGYLGVLSTVVPYAIWGKLLRRYSAVAVAPFSLLVPVVATLASFVVFGERFGPVRFAGMTAVLVGLAVIVAPRPGRSSA